MDERMRCCRKAASVNQRGNGRALQRRQLFVGRELVADLAFGNFTERSVFSGKFFQRLDEWAVAAAELFHAAGDDVNEDGGIADDFQGALEVIVSHGKVLVAPRGFGEGVTLGMANEEHDVYRVVRSDFRSTRCPAAGLERSYVRRIGSSEPEG